MDRGAPLQAWLSSSKVVSFKAGGELMRPGVLLSAVLSLLPPLIAPVSAQWLHERDPRIPRTKDGKPILTAKPPRAPDGKPDLSGVC
jgi:hypothetical protein